jgi:hypothetical protein
LFVVCAISYLVRRRLPIQEVVHDVALNLFVLAATKISLEDRFLLAQSTGKLNIDDMFAFNEGCLAKSNPEGSK